MKHARITAWLAFLLTLVTSATAAWAQAPDRDRDAALDMVPETAAAFVIVPDMDRFSQKLAAFNDQIGAETAALNDILGEFKRTSGMITGVNDSGTLMLVLPQAPTPQSMQGGFLMLMPVASYDEFTKRLGGNPAEQVTQVTLPSGFKGFSRSVSGYAVLGQTRTAVEAYQPGRNASALREALGGLGSRYIDQNDAMVVLNMTRLHPTLMPLLQTSIQSAMAEVEQAAMQRSLSRGKAQEARTMLGLYAATIRALATDSRMVTLGLDVSAQGAGITTTASFDPASPTGGILSNGGNAGQFMDQLPNQGYVSAFAADFGQINIKALADGIEQLLPPADEGGMLKLVRMALPLMRSTNGVASAYYTPPPGAAMMGGNLLSTVTVLKVEDGPAYRSALRGYINNMKGLESPTVVQDANGRMFEANIVFDTDYSPNTLNIDTIEVDQYSVRYQLPSEMLQSQAGSAVMLIGGSAQSGYVANRGNYIVTTTSTNPQMIKAALSTVDPQLPGLGSLDSIQLVRQAGMTPSPFVESLLNVRGLAQTARMFVGLMAPDSQDMVPVPEELPPVAFSASLQNSTFAGRAFVPTSVLLYARDATGVLQGQMMERPEPQQLNAGPSRVERAPQERPWEVEEQPWERQQPPNRPQQPRTPDSAPPGIF